MTIPGGWSEYRTQISVEAQVAFDEAVARMIGVNYSLIAVAEQTVAGKNYRYFCNAKVPGPDRPNYAVIITVHKPLDGVAEITDSQSLGDE